MKYNSLQIRLERRAASNGLFLLGAYTYSKATTNGVSGFGGDPGIVYFPVGAIGRRRCRVGQHRPAPQLHAQRAVSVALWQGQRSSERDGLTEAMLGGWSINTHLRGPERLPAGHEHGEQPVGHGVRQPARPGVRRHARRPDGAALVRHQLLRRARASACSGNAARTTLFGPGRWNADMALSKKFDRFQFRAEVFNVFNHAQFAAPGTAVGSPTFGVITSTVKGSRQVQLALKYVF